MNKSFVFLAVLLFTATLACGQSITVTAPNGGEYWTLGTPQGITWSSQGCTGNVRINLVKAGGGVFGTIDVVPVASGSYSWTVGQTNSGPAPAGDYRIGLYVPTQDVDDLSDGVFKIMAITDPMVDVYDPASGSQWQKGQKYWIRWRKTGEMRDRVEINLVNPDSLSRIMKISRYEGAPNSGSYEWEIPDSLLPGFYKIEVRDPLSVSGTSQRFEIKGAARFITITDPSPYIGWCLGDTQPIRWTFAGLSGNVSLDLLSENGKYLGKINTGIPVSSGKYTWVVGTYKKEQGKWYDPGNFFPKGDSPENRYFRIRIRAEGDTSYTSQRFLIMKMLKVGLDNLEVDSLGRRSLGIHASRCGNVGGPLSFSLRKAGSQEMVKSIGINNFHSGQNKLFLVWQVPAEVPAGEYLIRISTVDKKYSAVSDPFRLEAGN